jgi:peptidyl-prolyl cis-trans isomerase C
VRKAQADYVTKLREGAKVERIDQAAATPAPAAPAAPAAKDAPKPADSKMAPAKK